MRKLPIESQPKLTVGSSQLVSLSFSLEISIRQQHQFLNTDMLLLAVLLLYQLYKWHFCLLCSLNHLKIPFPISYSILLLIYVHFRKFEHNNQHPFIRLSCGIGFYLCTLLPEQTTNWATIPTNHPNQWNNHANQPAQPLFALWILWALKNSLRPRSLLVRFTVYVLVIVIIAVVVVIVVSLSI